MMKLVKKGYGSYSPYPHLKVTFDSEDEFEMLVELGFSLGIDGVGTSRYYDMCCSDVGHESALIKALEKAGVEICIPVN